MFALIKIAFCLVLLSTAALTQLPLLKFDLFTQSFSAYDYSPIFLVCFALSISFKNNYAFVAVLIYLLLGLFGLPIFAFGGGWSYVFEPSFGFLLALIPLSLLSFYFFYHQDGSTYETKTQKAFRVSLTVLAAHLFGLIYLAVTLRLSWENLFYLFVYQFVYDFCFAFVFSIISTYGYRNAAEDSDSTTTNLQTRFRSSNT